MPEQEGSLEDEVLGLARQQANGSMEDEVLARVRNAGGNSTEDGSVESQVLDLAREARAKAETTPAKGQEGDVDSFKAYLSEKIEESLEIAQGHINRIRAEFSNQGADESAIKATESDEYLKLATVMAEAGRYDSAISTLELVLEPLQSMKEDREKFILYQRIAHVQAKAGMYDEAKATADRIQIDSSKVDAYAAIASVQAKAGMIPNAKETFGLAIKIAEKVALSSRAEVYKSLGHAQAEVELYDDAEETLKLAIGPARNMRFGPQTKNVSSSLISVQAKLGHYNDAIQVVEMGKGNAWKAGAYADIASAQARAGKIDESKATIDLAVRLIPGITLDYEKSRVYSQIASAQANAEMRDEARKSIDLSVHHLERMDSNELSLHYLSPKTWMSIAYESIASAQEILGMHTEALETVEKIGEGYIRSRICLRIISSQAEAGMYDEAIKGVGVIYFDEDKLEAYTNISIAQAKAGLFDESKATMGLILPLIEKRVVQYQKADIQTKLASHYHDLLQGLEAA